MELDLLEENQIFGDKRLSIFDKYETRATITDFSVLLGVFVSSTFYTSEGNRTCWWWTKTDDGDDDVRIVCNNGNRDYSIVNRRYIGVRPALPYSSISNIFSNKEKSANGILEVLYGEYPQDIVDENYSRKLESAYNNGSLRTTGKVIQLIQLDIKILIQVLALEHMLNMNIMDRNLFVLLVVQMVLVKFYLMVEK